MHKILTICDRCGRKDEREMGDKREPWSFVLRGEKHIADLCPECELAVAKFIKPERPEKP